MSTNHQDAQMVDPVTGLPVYGMDLEIKKKQMAKMDKGKNSFFYQKVKKMKFVSGSKKSLVKNMQAKTTFTHPSKTDFYYASILNPLNQAR